MAESLQSNKHLYIVRGLPGSGKSFFCEKARRYAPHDVDVRWIEVDLLPDPSLQSVTLQTIDVLSECDAVYVDGIFPESQQVLSLVSRVIKEYPGIDITIINDVTEWATNPYKCWMKTVERAAESHPEDRSRKKLVPLQTIMDMWKRWEYVSFSGHSTNPE